MKHLADEFSSRDRVTFPGLATDQEVLDFCARCDIFCVLDTVELQSLVTSEAMAAGKPVVAADATALLRLVHPTATAASSCPVLWAPLLTLIELFGDPAARRSLGAAGPRERRQPRQTPYADGIRGPLPPRRWCPAAMTAFLLPLPLSAMESEHDEYAARSGRR
ncbi:glycosyltransferase [Streptomyces sp. NBC_01275]|uniref:glycosyltransferase n=1 Tax=Streptomyces sp. NBC_01275 TaxID=2903807 RepID=UPI0022530B97|nr:glycosyltransferase [Streptomyces sp. NBC_01275]MCX4760074.1 glycosyltransferase [Streptomyces sp. NBC_01275]